VPDTRRRSLWVLTRVVAFVVALVVVCGAAVVGVVAFTRSRSQAPPTTLVTQPPKVVPAAGQVFVTGSVSRVELDDAQGGRLVTPFTLVTAGPATGAATIEDALVAGKRTTIVWNGGSPLPLVGDGGVELDSADLVADDDGFRWLLGDGTVRALQPGRYRASAPVALGSTGLAQPADSVSFDADSTTSIVIQGEVTAKTPAQDQRFTGPGRAQATGALKITTAEGSQDANLIELSDGPYEVSLRESGSGYELDAVLQGPLQVE